METQSTEDPQTALGDQLSLLAIEPAMESKSPMIDETGSDPIPSDTSVPIDVPADAGDSCDNPTCSQVATLLCAICSETPCITSDPPVAQYCSTECQRADMLRHKEQCEKMLDRTTLYRVMDLALKQFYVFREMSWHAFMVEEVKRMGVKIAHDRDIEEVIVVVGSVSTCE